MARKNTRETWVDPFNAGEPVMPWDDPEALIDEVSSGDETARDAYSGPTKQPDNYEAPGTEDERRADGGTRARRNRPAWRRKRAGGRPGGRTAGSTSKRASKYLYLVILLGLILGLGAPVLTLAVGALSSIADGIDSLFTDESTQDTSVDIDGLSPFDAPDSTYGEPEPSAADEACIDAANAQMAAISTENDEACQTIAQYLSDELVLHTGYTAEELGIDGDAYAQWMLSHYSYELFSYFTYEDEGTAEVFYAVTIPNSYDIASDTGLSIYDYLLENDIDPYDGETLDEEHKARVREIFAETIEHADTELDTLASVSLDNINGTWTVATSVKDLVKSAGNMY